MGADSTGHAFTFPVVRLLGSAVVGCYVHYPTISTDMLRAVSSRRPGFNNPASVANSWVKTQAKLLYGLSLLWFVTLSFV